jgi:ABC-2 type transport system ATP-binding protein
MVSPPVLFLDEPTTGLDPRSRLELWEVIGDLRDQGTTIVLTTQYLEEADQLAQTISVIDGGHIIAEGTADELKDQVGGDRIELTMTSAADLDVVRRTLAPLAVGEMRTDATALQLTIPVSDGTASLTAALGHLAAERVAVRDAGLRRPTLDEVFLTLTGHQAGELTTTKEQIR